MPTTPTEQALRNLLSAKQHLDDLHIAYCCDANRVKRECRDEAERLLNLAWHEARAALTTPPAAPAKENIPMMLDNDTDVISTLNGVTGRRVLPALTFVFTQPPQLVTDEMVSRFLCWPLPKDFGPDGGISFTPFHPNGTTRFEPRGTNLLNYPQARAMLEHVLGADQCDRHAEAIRSTP